VPVIVHDAEPHHAFNSVVAQNGDSSSLASEYDARSRATPHSCGTQINVDRVLRENNATPRDPPDAFDLDMLTRTGSGFSITAPPRA